MSREIEVTPEMLKAGEGVLSRMTTYFGADEEVWAERVYIAMERARRRAIKEADPPMLSRDDLPRPLRTR